MQQRCVVVTENAANCDAPTVNLCTAVAEEAEAEMAPEPAPAGP